MTKADVDALMALAEKGYEILEREFPGRPHWKRMTMIDATKGCACLVGAMHVGALGDARRAYRYIKRNTTRMTCITSRVPHADYSYLHRFFEANDGAKSYEDAKRRLRRELTMRLDPKWKIKTMVLNFST